MYTALLRIIHMVGSPEIKDTLSPDRQQFHTHLFVGINPYIFLQLESLLLGIERNISSRIIDVKSCAKQFEDFLADEISVVLELT